MGNLFGNKADYGRIAGKAISAEDRVNAMHDVELDSVIKNQQALDPNTAEAIERAYYRLFIISKEKELGIHVSSKAMANDAQMILGQTSLDDFVNKVLKPMGMDDLDFERYLRHEVGLRQMAEAVGVNGRLVTPQEAETMYKLEHQDVESYLAYFSASNYLSAVKVTPEVIHQFYTNQIENYQVPEKVRVDYVKFNVTNYFKGSLAALTNLDQIVAMNVEHMGTNLFHGTKTAEESKAAVRDAIIRQHAIVDARREAGEFAEALDQMTPRTNSNLATLASSKGLATATTAPFEKELGPEDMATSPDFGTKAFRLTDDDPFGGPIVAEDGVYVIALKQRLAARIPPLSEIETKVTEDYRFASAVQIAQQAALKFDAVLTNGLAQGKSFASICAQNGVKYESLPPFNLSTRSLPPEIEERIGFSNLRRAAFSTTPGKASPVAGARDGAFIVYVEKQLPIDEAKMKSELPGFIAYLRAARQNDASEQWFRTQVNQDTDFVQILQGLAKQAQIKPSSARRPAS